MIALLCKKNDNLGRQIISTLKSMQKGQIYGLSRKRGRVTSKNHGFIGDIGGDAVSRALAAAFGSSIIELFEIPPPLIYIHHQGVSTARPHSIGQLFSFV